MYATEQLITRPGPGQDVLDYNHSSLGLRHGGVLVIVNPMHPSWVCYNYYLRDLAPYEVVIIWWGRLLHKGGCVCKLVAPTIIVY